MRRMIAQQWISADGYVAGPTGEAEIFAAVTDFADAERHNTKLLAGVDVLLFVRRTYELFAGSWPTSDGPIAATMNALPKVVCSTTLTEAPWGQHAPAEIVTDAVAFVRRLTGSALIWGSIVLMRSLLAAGLLDELELLVAPIALGSGTLLLAPGERYRLQLRASETWRSGAVRLRYAVGDQPPE